MVGEKELYVKVLWKKQTENDSLEFVIMDKICAVRDFRLFFAVLPANLHLIVEDLKEIDAIIVALIMKYEKIGDNLRIKIKADILSLK